MENYKAKTLFTKIVEGISIYDSRESQSIAYWFLEEKFGLKRADILVDKTIEIDPETINQFIERINVHEPLQYILGKTWFYGLPFHVRSGVLIPRPETEELVDLIIKDHKGKEGLNILDIGTGSGCIAVSLAANMPSCSISAMDISADALQIASENAVLNKVSVQFIQHDISQDWKGEEHFDIIVSNPPYIERPETELMRQNVLKFEPDLALFAPESDPLFFYRKILEFAVLHLNSNGRIYFEINERFGEETKVLMEKFGFQQVDILKDLNGKDRMVKGYGL
jgi:release factor glutamine methyltransferase